MVQGYVIFLGELCFRAVYTDYCYNLMIGSKIILFPLYVLLLPRMTWGIPGCAQILLAFGWEVEFGSLGELV